MTGGPTYAFLPWVRQGLGLHLDATSGTRATLEVGIGLSGEAIGGGSLPASVNHTVELYGPGDVVGLDPRAVIAYEPRDGTTNFESNYLAYVAFYDEVFPWRYTPAAPVGDRLVPWISLVVL